MTEARDASRREARRRRAVEKSEAQTKAETLGARVAEVMSEARVIVNDEHFIELVKLQGICTVPALLSFPCGPGASKQNVTAPNKKYLDQTSLTFLIAWSFFFPLLSNTEIVAFLEKRWPRFVWDLKDAFITIVINGPFPVAISGHKGRRHTNSPSPKQTQQLRNSARSGRSATRSRGGPHSLS